MSTPVPSEIGRAFSGVKGAFLAVAAFSAVINVLMLTGSLFMMEVYDRVLPSRSVPTLLGLAAIVVFLYAMQGLLELIRGRILVRIGKRVDEQLAERVCEIDMRLPVSRPAAASGADPIRDLDAIRSFLSGQGPAALCDLPWAPFFLAICFALHPLLGATALSGSIVLVVLTLAAETWTRAPMDRVAAAGTTRARLSASARRAAEVIAAMGLSRPIAGQVRAAQAAVLLEQTAASDITGGIGAAVRTMRMILQSAVLGVGAYLVIQQEVSPGVIIAASIIAARALSPVDQAIANWKSFVTARQSRARLDMLLASMPPQPALMALPPPRSILAVERLAVSAPEGGRLVLRDINFRLEAGSAVGVIGPSASGKTALARALVGVWAPSAGSVRLDGAALDQWPRESLGRHLGYMPQDVELIEGTIAQNIGRFDPAARAGDIVAAARAAGVHEMIVALPDGYATRVGHQGAVLSAGQRQRIALARALYGEPFLIVLDEPNSNLDAEGEEALRVAILRIRNRGGVAVVIAHRPAALAGVDCVLTLINGQQQGFGPKEAMLNAVLQRDQDLRRRVNLVGSPGNRGFA